MDELKKAMLEKAGWKIGDAADFLEMTDEEKQALEEAYLDRKSGKNIMKRGMNLLR